jgi:hypothetical protein
VFSPDPDIETARWDAMEEGEAWLSQVTIAWCQEVRELHAENNTYLHGKSTRCKGAEIRGLKRWFSNRVFA